MYLTGDLMDNLLSYCGLVDAKIRASDKDLPLHQKLIISSLRVNPIFQKGDTLLYSDGFWFLPSTGLRDAGFVRSSPG